MQVNKTMKRPAIMYPGGKWRLARWIIENLPPHDIYVEPFGGAASILIRKEPSRLEVYNDVFDDIVNLFQIMQTRPDELLEKLRYTPYARTVYNAAFDDYTDAVDRAHSLIVRSYMGFSTTAVNGKNTGFKSRKVARSGGNRATTWHNYVKHLPRIIARFRTVVIENKPALDLIEDYNVHHALIYCDPPYLLETRANSSKLYANEMSDNDHLKFLDTILASNAMVVVSGYPSPVYDDALAGWHKVEKQAIAQFSTKSRGTERTEVLWLNPLAYNMLSESKTAPVIEKVKQNAR